MKAKPVIEVRYFVDGRRAWTVRETAAFAGVTAARVLQVIAKGEISPCATTVGFGGRTWLIWPTEVRRWSRGRRPPGRRPAGTAVDRRGRRRAPARVACAGVPARAGDGTRARRTIGPRHEAGS